MVLCLVINESCVQKFSVHSAGDLNIISFMYIVLIDYISHCSLYCPIHSMTQLSKLCWKQIELFLSANALVKSIVARSHVVIGGVMCLNVLEISR